MGIKMTYNKEMISVLNYIDENIKGDLSIEKLAEISTFSEPHFFRLFLSYMDITPMKYMLRRKLYFAAKELISSDTKIVDIAFSYGFESHDVFSRAFKRHYGITPNAFRKNGSSLNKFYKENSYCISDYVIPDSLFDQNKDVKLERSEYEAMEHEVKIVTLPETKLIGIDSSIGGDEWAYDTFYNAYDKVFRNAPNRKYPNSTNATHALSELRPDGTWNYFIGIEVTSLEDVPQGALCRTLPKQLCAVVGYEGGLDYQIVSKYLYGTWFERNTYKIEHNYPGTWEYYAPNKDCEVYGESIYMPIMTMDYDIVEIPSYSGVYIRVVHDEKWQAKDKAFSIMLSWAKENNLFDGGEINLEVYFGNTEDEQVFCEVFYRTEMDLPMCDGMKRKSYPLGKYFHTSSIHNAFEQNGRAIWRYIEQNKSFSFSDSGKPDCRSYFDEYHINRAELDAYTPIDVYVCIQVEEVI